MNGQSSKKLQGKMSRKEAIAIIERSFPADAVNQDTAAVGRKLLDDAKVSDWRNASDKVLSDLATRSVAEDNKQATLRRAEERAKAEPGKSYYICLAGCVLNDEGGKNNRPVTCSAKAHGDRVPDVIAVDGKLGEKLTAKFGLLASPSEYEMERAVPVSLSPALMEGGE